MHRALTPSVGSLDLKVISLSTGLGMSGGVERAAWRRLALANWQREAAWQHSDGGVLPGHWQSGGRSRVGAVQNDAWRAMPQVQVQMPGVQKPEARLVALSSSKLLSECEVAVEGWLQAICKYLGTTNTPEIRCAATYRPRPAL